MSVETKSKQLPNHVRLKGSDWIETHRSELSDNQWVAADDSGFLGASPSNAGLMRALQEKGVQLDRVAIAFITSRSV